MLMNFNLGDGVLNSKAVFKGGRWRDRLTAKKSTILNQRRKLNQNHSSTNGTTVYDSHPSIQNSEIVVTERPQKRQKLSDHHDRSQRILNIREPREVVSSLFSYNPISKVPVSEHTEEGLSAEPSNAPLASELDTFTSLGLSTTLAAFLLTKLGLKAPTAIQKEAITQLIKEDSDAFIQAETGSGKTLAYLLPIVQRIMELSKRRRDDFVAIDQQVHRSSGLFAIILAPTRELCKQISIVLDNLLRCAHWLVAGTVIGGEKKKSEKARLRKGLNILVATPGRLADHLDNTEVLNVSNVRWLVLDEGDRLMELGFEEEIRGIVMKLEDRSKAATNVGTIPGLPTHRTTVLCSATMKMNVQRLGEISLKEAVHIKADPTDSNADQEGKEREALFSAPSQLKQSYIVVPPKQRLVTLAALLKRTFARKGSVMKAIVFLSCADSVDFHFEIFARKVESTATNKATPPKDIMITKNTMVESDTSSAVQMSTRGYPPETSQLPTISITPSIDHAQNPNLRLYKLHGSLPQTLRTATLAAFSRSSYPSILLCTDVASRGLDLPNIDLVIEYDPPFSSDDHLHRVGRTARAGRDGRAVIFLMPGPEEGYVHTLKSGSRDLSGKKVGRSEAAGILKRGFGEMAAAGKAWEEKATEWQLEAERWVIEDQQAGEMARKAFVSHVRAYATHVAKEREMFDVKALHLGHLAKAFALREKPGSMGRGGVGKGGRQPKLGQVSKSHGKRREGSGKSAGSKDEGEGEVEISGTLAAARKMRAKMKEHLAGANEFNIG